MSDAAIPKGYELNITPIAPQDGALQSWSVRADIYGSGPLLRSMGTIDFHDGTDVYHPRGFFAWVGVVPSPAFTDGNAHVGVFETLVDAVRAIEQVDDWIDDEARP